MNKPSPQARNKIGALQSLYDVASPAALLIIALFVFLITPPAQAQDYTSNLMAHWTLDETAGNTIADETSNNNDGVWSDGTGDDVTEESTAGVIGNALTFDGTNDRIFIGNHTGLSFAAGEDFSVAAWVKLDNCQSSGSKIIENKSSSYYNLQCYASENQMRFQVRDSNSVQAWALATSTTINDSQWHHVVGVKNGHDLHIYIDGVLEGTNDTKTFNGSVGGNDVRIGYSVDGGSRNVDGTLDEVRVYNRALTAADITALYNLSASTPALTGHWTLDDAAGAVATDDSDTGNNGALENAPTWVEGNLSGAVEFTEASDRIKIPSNAAYNISTGGGYSAFFWFRKTTDCGPNNEVMLSRFGLNHGDRTWWIGCSTDDKLRLVLHGDTAELDLLGAPTVIDDGQWHHAGWVYDGAAGQTRLYLDGNLEDSINGTLDVDVDIANPICVASYNATCSDGQYYFDGTLDDIRLYNYALTDAEIGTLYNSGSQKLVAHWKLDETTGNTIIDSSGNGNTGTWSDGDDNDVTGESGAGIIDNALTFDGSNDQIFVGNHSGLKFSVDQNFTVAAWVNLNNCQSSGSKFVESKTGTSFYNLQCYASENQVRFQVRDNNAEMGYALGTTLVNDSQWHHVVGVKNGNDLHIYVDGVLEGTDDTKTFATSIGGDDVRIGYSVDGGSRNVDGKLDDIRIYNYALSDAQITALYNDTSGEGAGSCNTPNAIEGTLRYNTDQHVMQYCNGSTWLTIGRQDTSSGSGVNLVGHWKLDETTGNTITDSSGNGNTGTWSDGDDNDVTGETGAGAIDNALTFDGTNDYILISDSPNIGFTNADNFTFAAWVKLNSCQSSGSKIIEIKSVSSGEDTITLQCYSSTNLTFFGMRDNNSVSNDLEGTTPINDGAWHHVVGVKNGNTLSVYVDGVLENSDNSVNYTGDFPANDLRIGWSINGGARKVDGTLDDIRVYSGALSPSQISSLYAMGNGIYSEPDTATLIAHWTLDEITGTQADDSSTNNYHGTLTNMTANSATSEGKFGKAMYFDGTNQYIEIADNADLSGGTGKTFTWAFWFNVDQTPATEYHIIRKDKSINEKDWGFGYYSDNTLGFYREGNGSDDDCRITTIFSPGTWYHITTTYNGPTDTMQMYVNGALDNTCVLTYDLIDTDTPVMIGKRSYDSSHLFKGYIDDVRIYSSVLDAAVIDELYKATSGGAASEPESQACGTMASTEGEIVFNTTYYVMQYCNGTNWIAMGPPGNGGVNCNAPAGLPGELRYASDLGSLIYCEGDQWIGVAAQRP